MNSILVIFAVFCKTIFKSYDRDSPAVQKGLIIGSQKTAKKSQKMSIINRNLLVVQKGPQNWPIQPCDVS